MDAADIRRIDSATIGRVRSSRLCRRAPATDRGWRHAAQQISVHRQGAEKTMSSSSDLPGGNDKPGSLNRRELLKAGTSLVAATAIVPALAKTAAAAGGTPNILVIFGDDIGYWNISAYNRGMMGYRTPNIDSIAKEGAIFTDLYAQQSCTAGRAAFITGQSCFRTGLLKVGLPGAPEGLSDKDPTLAELLKPQGYATGQC